MFMRHRQICFRQPEPGRRASNRYSKLLREFERHKPAAAAAPIAMGLGCALALHLLRKAELNGEISRRDQNAQKLKRIDVARERAHGHPSYASNTNIDVFLKNVMAEVAEELRNEISASDVRILELESEAPGCSFVKDSGLITAAFAAAMLAGIAGIKMLAKSEERKAALCKKVEEPQKPLEGRAAERPEGITHATAEFSPAVALQKEEPPGAKFQRPAYYDLFFNDLKSSISEEMGLLGSAEAAEAFLCVMGRKDIEELVEWPETIEIHIAANRDALREFFAEKKIDPKALFARLGPEVAGLF